MLCKQSQNPWRLCSPTLVTLFNPLTTYPVTIAAAQHTVEVKGESRVILPSLQTNRQMDRQTRACTEVELSM